MKAFTYSSYGTPQKVLQLKGLDKPIPAENDVVIKVTATTINDYDWSLITGKPLLYRLMFGLFKPKFVIPGMELSGIIDTVGANVKNFKVGDAVYGDISENSFGTFAEYVCVKPQAVLKMSKGMSHIEAAALPHAGLLALQALEKAGLKEGQKVLINGGGGGVGTLAVQLCKLKNCEVTGVDSGEKQAKMLEIGFDHVLDYKKEDFTKNGIQYDVVLDCKTQNSAFAYLKSLTLNGTYVTVGGKVGKLLSLAIWSKLTTLFTSKKLLILALKPNKNLEELGALIVQNKLRNLIDGPYSFEEIPSLVQYFGEGKHQGKIVIQVSEAME